MTNGQPAKITLGFAAVVLAGTITLTASPTAIGHSARADVTDGVQAVFRNRRPDRPRGPAHRTGPQRGAAELARPAEEATTTTGRR